MWLHSKAIRATALTLLALAIPTIQAAKYRNIVYFKEWTTYAPEGDFHLFDLDWSRATHVKYGFAVPQADGTVTLDDPYAAIIRNYFDPPTNATNSNVARGTLGLAYILKKKFRTTKFGLSIGGEQHSDNFSALAMTDAGRRTFASTSVQLMQDLGLDFIDVYWASPVEGGGIPHTPNDMQNLVLLLEAIRKELAKLQFPSELTAVAPATQKSYRHWDTYNVCSFVDHLHVSSFGFTGNALRFLDHHEHGQRWLQTTNLTNYTEHQANLYPDPNNPGVANSVDGALQHYLNGGCPSTKLVMGIPSFGRSYENTGGLYGAYTPPTTGSWVYQGSGLGVWDYKSLPLSGAAEVFDPKLVAAYSYDPTRKMFTSYDNPQSVAAKLEYIKKFNLGGTMYWSGDADATGGAMRSLITQAYNAFGPANMAFSQNTINYPNSKYANIQDSTPLTTAAPSPTATSGPGNHCAGMRNVCFWPVTQQVVVAWTHDDCAKHANVFVWCS
ncbi:hypothetical protein DYB37_007730 [Aphanomyces astaci]|uniref:GH18 domain-containing protein n=1 Tax=Aphanomyces astaci TaxID=112090 RepID=A0A3R6YKC2_APHAT|nr:hypothetical protein DYB37_007730 [Aphanomyces astaci]